jgi:biotin carboxyl carrier protein
MAIQETEASRGSEPAPGKSSGLMEQWAAFNGPPQEFLSRLLALQCQLAPAESGAVLRAGAEGRVDIVAVEPPMTGDGPQPSWLGRAATMIPEVVSTGGPVVKTLAAVNELYGQPSRRHVVVVPLRGKAPEVAAFVLEVRDAATLTAICQRLELTAALLSFYEMRLSANRRQADLRRLRGAMETVASVNEHDRFAGLAMALCNELATRFQADRVSVGFLKGRYVHLKATSHTEKFNRKMKIVQDVEAAMEECVDQDVEVLYPASSEATFVSRAAAELSRRHGPVAVLSLPLRYGGKPVAALTLERAADQPFTLEEAESVRLSADLITPRLTNLEEHDRWIGARAVLGLRQALAAVVGPKHTWIKLAVIIIVGFLAFAIFGVGTYRVEAPFVFQPIEQQVVSAPFEGYLASVNVEPGDRVVGGKTVLATLETAELVLRRGDARGEYAKYTKQADDAAAQDKIAEAQIARAQAESIAAQIDLLTYQIDHAQLISPTSGIVVSGDLKRLVGARVKLGDALFEVAPIESLRAELAVPDDEMADVQLSQEGELATASYPGRHLSFEIERINPMSEVAERQNVFKVRARLGQTEPWMRPGMEGLAKIDVRDQRYIWIWTRPLVKWVRMKLWL